MVRPVDIALQLLELVSRSQPVGVSELARFSGLPKSTVHRSLQSLQEAGWIEAKDNQSARWVITIKASITCGRATAEQSSVRNIALPVMEELRRTTEETIHLTYRYDRSMILIERLDGIKPVRYFFPYGTVYALHTTSAGKALLSLLPDDEVGVYLENPLEAWTDRTVTDHGALLRDLAAARDLGYATNFGGHVSDVHAVGAAIIDRTGRPFASLSISAPADRLPESLVNEYGALVSDAARRVSIGVVAMSG